jgi:hypothetical protein
LRSSLRRQDLEPLVRRHLSLEEDEGTARLSRRLQAARRRGYLTPSELEAVCRWKSARAIWHIRANTHHQVRAATSAALATRGERQRIDALLQLRGVSVPMASAVLTLLHPRRYGVIDIRVWQLLHRIGAVNGNAKGTSLTRGNWLEFLSVLRALSSSLGAPARAVERTLFNVHRAHQKGTLYAAPKVESPGSDADRRG